MTWISLSTFSISSGFIPYFFFIFLIFSWNFSVKWSTLLFPLKSPFCEVPWTNDWCVEAAFLISFSDADDFMVSADSWFSRWCREASRSDGLGVACWSTAISSRKWTLSKDFRMLGLEAVFLIKKPCNSVIIEDEGLSIKKEFPLAPSCSSRTLT